MAAEVSDQPTSDYRPEGAEILDEQRAAALAGEPPFAAEKPRRENRVLGSFKDSMIAAVVAVALFGPLVVVHTLLGPGSRLAVNQRWELLAVVVAVVFAARL